MKALARIVAIRGANAVGLIIGVVLLSYLMIHIVPGGPIEALEGSSGSSLTEQTRAALTTEFGLNLAWYSQAWLWIVQLIHGNLGVSFIYHEQVSGLVLSAFASTALLASTAFVLSVFLGVVSGVLAARKPFGVVSRVMTVISVAGYAAPPFWTAIILLVLFAQAFQVFPVEGMQSPIPPTGVLPTIGDIAIHLVLPATVLTLAWVGSYSRTTRASMLDVMGSDYVRTARAKGVSELSVLFKHGLRNALLPVVTLAGLQLGTMVSGALLVETVFSWPGIGPLALHAVADRDTPVLVGIFLVSSIAVILANLVTDFLYTVIDPRIRVN